MEKIIALPLWPVMVFLLGACIGSFLNVVIYRVPLGLGVSDPKRSYCPHCKKDIPWYRNLPMLTWLLQRGKCAECGAPIAFRYFFVEAVTAGLFLAAWMVLPVPFPAAFFVMALCVLLVVISFIDAEHMIIPMNFVCAGLVIGLIAGVVAPALVFMGSPVPAMPSWAGGAQALLGIVVGWGVLALVVVIGKYFFGERRMMFDDQAETWRLREPENDEEELRFVVGEEELDWSEVFCRKKDRIEIEGHGILLDGKRTEAKRVVILEDRIVIDDKEHMIAKIGSLEGKADLVVIPREAMGGGDPPLMGMIGAFLGWQGVLFALFTSCIYALVAAVLGRIGFGRALPFGPFLALGGLTWVFGGWQLWEMYFAFARGN
jgi:leader peptidase (prepilin peptidase)/N-methyltransferase